MLINSIEETSTVPLEGKIFLYIVLGEFLLVLIAGIAHIVFFPTFYTIFFTCIVITTAVFLLYFACDAIFKENEFQLVAFLVLSLLLTARVAYNFLASWFDDHYNDPSNPTNRASVFMLTPLIVCSICELLYLILGVFVFRSFGWRQFRRVGTNVDTISRYKHFQIFMSLLKLDVYFVTQLGIVAGFFLTYYHWTLVFVILFVVLSLLFSVLASKMARRENRAYLVFFSLWNLALPAYIIFQLVMMFWKPSFFFSHLASTNDNIAPGIRTTATIMISIASTFCLTVRFLLYSSTVVIWRNFGKGLKEIFARSHASPYVFTYGIIDDN